MAMCEYAWTSFKTNAKWWEFAPQDAERFHPTQKPLGLICRQLEEYTKPGDLVLDAYSGSGTVAVACQLLGRRFIAVEKNAMYWRMSVERLRSTAARVADACPGAGGQQLLLF
jgi:site-specific DNA-methyltransferase (adenine-specific)